MSLICLCPFDNEPQFWLQSEHFVTRNTSGKIFIQKFFNPNLSMPIMTFFLHHCSIWSTSDRHCARLCPLQKYGLRYYFCSCWLLTGCHSVQKLLDYSPKTWQNMNFFWCYSNYSTSISACLQACQTFLLHNRAFFLVLLHP